MEPFYALGSGDDAHKLNMAAAVGFNKIDGGDCGAAGRQHGIRYDDGALFDGARKLAVLFVGLMGLFVTVKPDVAHFGRGDQGKDPVYPSPAGP